MRTAKFLLLALLFMAPAMVHSQEQTYYVSPRGNDKHAGTEARPFKTLQHALWQACKARSNEDTPVKIVLAGGEYPMTEMITINGIRNITITAADNQTPVLLGDATLKGWKPVTDSKVLERLPAEARGKVWQADLRKAGITDVGEIVGNKNRIDLYYNGIRQQVARWPNDKHAEAGKALGFTPIKEWEWKHGFKEGIFEYKDARIDRWAEETDIYAHGYWFWDWAESYKHVEKIDKERKAIVLDLFPKHQYDIYGYREGLLFYGMNLLCEMDTPGEYYVDRANSKVYLFEPEGFIPQAGQVSMSRFNGDYMLQVDNSTNITISGLVLRGGRNGAIRCVGSKGVKVADCRITQFGDDAVLLKDSKDFRMSGCLLQQLGHGGMEAHGGNRKTLEPADYVVENTIFSDFSLYKPTYEPAIIFYGAGMTISHNLFRKCASSALRLEGNDILVEYNHFKDVVTESDDQGGIDIYYNVTYRGIVIRYNYWKDIVGGSLCGAAGIRMDDMISGVNMYGNVFDNCGAVHFGSVQIHGGKDNVVENNIVYHCLTPVSFSKWRESRWKEELFTTAVLRQQAEVDFPSALYKGRYPELTEDITLHINRNFVRKNLSVSCQKKLHAEDKDNVIEDNVEIDSDKPLEYFLQPAVQREYGLKPIPFEAMGVKQNRWSSLITE